jgi:hypothetical protein
MPGLRYWSRKCLPMSTRDSPDTPKQDHWTKTPPKALKANKERFDSRCGGELRKRLTQVVVDSLQSALPMLQALSASNAPISHQRIHEWSSDSAKRFLACLSESTAAQSLFGGRLPGSEACLYVVAVAFSTVLADLLQLVAPTVLVDSEEDRSVSKVLREWLVALSLKTEDWESKLSKLLSQHNELSTFRIIQLLESSKRTWTVLLHEPEQPRAGAEHEPKEGCRPDLAGYRIGGVWYLGDVFAECREGDSVDELTRVVIAHGGGRGFVVSAEEIANAFAEAGFGDAAVRTSRNAWLCNVSCLPGALSKVVSEHLSNAHAWITLHVPVGDIVDANYESSFTSGYVVGRAFRQSADRATGEDDWWDHQLRLGDRELVWSAVPCCRVSRQISERILEWETDPPWKVWLQPLISVPQGDLRKGGSVERLNFGFHFWKHAEMRLADASRYDSSPTEIADCYMSYCTVVEVITGGGAGVTEQVASRMAGVLANDPRDRRDIYLRLKRLYDKRSKFVHEGRLQIERADLAELREHVRCFLLYCIDWVSRPLPSRDGLSLMLEYIGLAKWKLPSDVEVASPFVRANTPVQRPPDIHSLDESPIKWFESRDLIEHLDFLRFGESRVAPIRGSWMSDWEPEVQKPDNGQGSP